MPLTPEERAALELDRVVLCDAEEDEQTTYLAQNGKHRQRLRTDARVRGDVRLWVDEYVSPRGPGYLETSEATVNAIVYRQVEDHGPATHFDEHDWREFRAP